MIIKFCYRDYLYGIWTVKEENYEKEKIKVNIW